MFSSFHQICKKSFTRSTVWRILPQSPRGASMKRQRPLQSEGKPTLQSSMSALTSTGGSVTQREFASLQPTSGSDSPTARLDGSKAVHVRTKRDKKPKRNASTAAGTVNDGGSVNTALSAAEHVLATARQLASVHEDSIRVIVPKKARHRKQKALEVAADNAMDEPQSSSRFARVIVTTTVSFPPDDDCTNTAPTVPTTARIFVKPLLVLDLNGILCFRLRRDDTNSSLPPAAYRPAMGPHIAMTPIISRPDRHDFLDFLDQHFMLAIWTSAKAKTAKALVKLLLPETISRKLVFVWAQHHCQVDDSHQHGQPNTKVATSIKVVQPSKVIYQKDLGQVWKAFPLWNQSNTLLMDDSPDKCVAWQENAVHPPALNGRTSRRSETDFFPDEDNVVLQRAFFERLVAYWQQHNTVHDWDGEAGDAMITNGDGQLHFLRDHAGPHMGWKPSSGS